MKRKWGFTILTLFVAVAFVSGCAQKEVLKEDTAAQKQAASKVTKPAAQVPEKSAPKEDEAAKKRAERERAEREALKAKAQKEAAAKAAEKAATVASSKESYEFADIHFDFDNFNLRDEARVTLNKHVEWLNKNKDVKIVIEGHCDERGTAEYNLALGERRANVAAKYLIDMGIDGKRIRTISYGMERPLDPQHNEEAWTKNRRAHFAISRIK